MKQTETAEVAPSGEITHLIRCIREQRVILDADLAFVYGVETKVLNRAVKRNPLRFPEEFVFRLTSQEWTALRCQIGTLKVGRGQHRKYLPHAFTEHGALMASAVLESPRAVAMNIYIIRAFVKMREDQAANAAILKRLAEIDKTLLVHDVALREIFDKLRPLLAPPPPPPKPEIGFHAKEAAIPYRVNRRSLPRRRALGKA
jgi:hypothetical protein